jgi:large subunit ribosomal protein L17
MRHGDKINNLGRKLGHRNALLKNLSASLIQHKRIFTTLAKAKALRKHLEPLITKSKLNTTHSRRVVFSYLQNKEAAKEMFDNIGPKVADRPGGYLRIIRTGFRRGDAADMAMIEFVDYNEVYSGDADATPGAEESKTRTRRSRGAKKSSDIAEVIAPVAVAASVAASSLVEEVEVVEVVREVEAAPVVETVVETIVETPVITEHVTIIEQGEDDEWNKVLTAPETVVTEAVDDSAYTSFDDEETIDETPEA